MNSIETKEERLEYLINKEGINKLKNSNLIIFGLGGVGSFCAESLIRSFVGNITLVDYDTISISNINRQLPANINTIGKYKVCELKKRFLEINPDCNINTVKVKLNKDNIYDIFNNIKYDYVIDAIDDIGAKIELIKYCLRNKIKIISSMGMGNKIKPELIRIDKLQKTSVCAIARILRRNLKNINIPVVYSLEHPIKHTNNRPGSTSFTPPVAGFMIASYVVREIIK